jgi:hypothetical protein
MKILYSFLILLTLVLGIFFGRLFNSFPISAIIVITCTILILFMSEQVVGDKL